MIKTKKKLLLAFLLGAGGLFAGAGALFAAGKWEPITFSKGISVFKREDPNSNMFEFLGVGTVDAPAWKLITLLQDIPLMPEWVEDCKRAEELFKNYDENSVNKPINEFTSIIYGVQGAPWPITDRDYVLVGKIKYDVKNDAAILDLHEGKHPKKPEQSGMVRMNFMRVRMTLTPKDNDRKTEVKFYVHVDPGGLLPAWAVNFVTKKVPYNSILKLRELAKRSNYDKGIEKMVIAQIKKIRVKKPASKGDDEDEGDDE